jgi:hypothetical protein
VILEVVWLVSLRDCANLILGLTFKDDCNHLASDFIVNGTFPDLILEKEEEEEDYLL